MYGEGDGAVRLGGGEKGVRVERRLLAWEEESLRECSDMFHNIVLPVDVTDSWRWLLDPVHGYSVRDPYRFLTNSGDQVDRSLVDDVWHRNIPVKVSLFVWRLLRNRLPSKDNLLRQNIVHANDLAYVTGCGEVETATHLFLDWICPLPCGFLSGIGLGSRWFLLVRFVIISFSFHSWQGCRVVLTRSLRLSGLPVSG